MTEDNPLVTAGGWCAPTDAIYDAMALNRNEFTHIGFPHVSVSKHWHTPTPEETRERDAVQRLNEVLYRRMSQQVTDAIDRACIDALREGWDIHVWRAPRPFVSFRHVSSNEMSMQAYVGIEFRPAEHPVPTIHEHVTPDWWDDDD